MTFKSLAFFLFAFTICATSCTKTTTQTIITHDTTTVIDRDTIVVVAPKNPIIGLWIGSQMPNDGSSAIPLYYSFDLEADNSLIVVGSGADGNTYYSIGTWSLSGTAFSGTLTVSNFSQAGVSQTLTGTYSSSAGTLNGTVHGTNGVNYTASFALNRIN